MDDDKIVEQILLKLDGWKLDTDITEDGLIDSQYNKSISSDEVLHFYNTAYNYALAYTGLPVFPTQTNIINDEEVTDLTDITYTALFLWTAGLLWEKYNIRTNNQLDETNPYGYGDKLIIQAKEILKPLKTYAFYAY
ncbi:hypothetical protein [Methanobrevibacter sp.]